MWRVAAAYRRDPKAELTSNSALRDGGVPRQSETHPVAAGLRESTSGFVLAEDQRLDSSNESAKKPFKHVREPPEPTRRYHHVSNGDGGRNRNHKPGICGARISHPAT